MAGGDFTDHLEPGRHFRDIVGADGIAIHRGDSRRRLGDACRDIGGQDAAERAQEPDLLATERMEGGDDARRTCM